MNDHYVRLLGRGEGKENNSRTFNWPNAGLEFEFSGIVAEVYVDEALYDEKRWDAAYNGSYFTMAVYHGDSLVRTERIKLVKGRNPIYTYKNGGPEIKKIMPVRLLEACKRTIRMSKLKTDALPKASRARERRIEFIGDSYTAGFGNSPELSNTTNYTAQNTDNWNSYTGVVARHYGADNNVIAYMGKSLYANRSMDVLEHTMADQFHYNEIYTDTDMNLDMSTASVHDFSDYCCLSFASSTPAGRKS